ncbi:MAG: ATP-binding cassette domain-containing protein [Clostridiales bacterium]|nr:ATP-binding cassette domain-containing protein [Clostridiales bacterium]
MEGGEDLALESIIRFEHVSKNFQSRKLEVHAVKDVNLEIEKGEIFGIIGFSGAGKSTLVRCMNLLERPTTGNVFFQGRNLCRMKNKELRETRQKMGMIFQQFNLLEQRDVWGNIYYPLEIAGVDRAKRAQRIEELLDVVDLADKAHAFPSQLSGGQKQRVAIARALATDPEVILCDEATSALDPITTEAILDLLKKINESRGVTIVVITHEMRVAEQICDRIAVMNQGKVAEIGTVQDIFLKPKSETARKLIQSGGLVRAGNHPAGSLRIAFDGHTSSDPIISELTVYCDEMINILGANTENIGGKAYGQILIEIPANPDKLHKMEHFLTEKGIHYEIGGNV